MGTRSSSTKQVDASPRVACPFCDKGYFRRIGNPRKRGGGMCVGTVKCKNCDGWGTMTENELKAMRERIERMNTPIAVLEARAKEAREKEATRELQENHSDIPLAAEDPAARPAQ